MGTKVGEVEVLIDADASAMEAELKAAEATVKKVADRLAEKAGKVADNAAKGAEKAASSMRATLAQVGQSAVVAGESISRRVTEPLMAFAKSAVDSAAKFQDMESQLRQATEGTADQMKELSGLARQLGNDAKLPGVAAADSMAAMLALSKGGLSVAETAGAARGALLLATAAGQGFGESADFMATAVRAFNLEGKVATKVADLLAAAANESTSEVGDLQQGFQMGALVAKQANLRIEEFTAMLGLMANAGIRGSDAGTSVKTMLMSLMAPSESATKMMGALGIELYDTQGRLKPFPAILDAINGSLAGLTEEARNQALAKIFGTDGIRAATVALGAGREGFERFVKTISRQGAAADAAAARMGPYNRSLEILNNKIDDIKLALGTKALGMLASLADKVGSVVDVFSKLPDPVQNVVMGVLAVAVAIGPAVLLFGQLASAAAALGPILAAVGTVLAGPVGIAIAAVVAAVAALVFAWNNNFMGIRDKTMEFVQWVTPILTQFANDVRVWFEKAVEWAGKVWAEFSVELKKFADEWGPIVQRAWAAIRIGIENYLRPTIAVIRTAWESISTFLRENWGTITKVAGLMWENLKTVVSTIFQNLRDGIKIVLQLISGDFSGAGRTYGQIWDRTWKAIGDIARNFIPILKGIGELIVKGLVAGFENAKKTVIAFWNALGDNIQSTFKSVMAIKSPSRVMMQLGEYVVQGLGDGMSSVISRVEEVTKAISVAIQSGFAEPQLRAGEGLGAYVERQTAALKAYESALGSIKTNISKALDPRAKIADFVGIELSAYKQIGEALQANLMKHKLIELALTRQIRLVNGGKWGIGFGPADKSSSPVISAPREDSSWLEGLNRNPGPPVWITSLMKGIDMAIAKAAEIRKAALDTYEANTSGTRGGVGWINAIMDGANVAIAKMKQIDEYRQRVADRFLGIFDDLFRNGFQNFFESVTKGFNQLLQDMAWAYIRSGLAEMIGNALGGDAMTRIFGALSGGAGRAMSLHTGGLMTAALGGNVAGGVPITVGERGREVFVPSSNGRIVPNSDLGGTTTINITVNMHGGGDAASVKRSGQQVALEVGRRVQDAIRRA